jgi:hypothetical protein
VLLLRLPLLGFICVLCFGAFKASRAASGRKITFELISKKEKKKRKKTTKEKDKFTKKFLSFTIRSEFIFIMLSKYKFVARWKVR